MTCSICSEFVSTQRRYLLFLARRSWISPFILRDLERFEAADCEQDMIPFLAVYGDWREGPSGAGEGGRSQLSGGSRGGDATKAGSNVCTLDGFRKQI